MLVNYVRRHGWRHSLLALVNSIVILGILLQTGGLLAVSSTRRFFEDMSQKNGFGSRSLFGSWLVDVLLQPITVWVLAGAMVVIIVKEFFVTSLRSRLAINAVIFVFGFAATIYVTYVLYAVPMNVVGMDSGAPSSHCFSLPVMENV